MLHTSTHVPRYHYIALWNNYLCHAYLLPSCSTTLRTLNGLFKDKDIRSDILRRAYFDEQWAFGVDLSSDSFCAPRKHYSLVPTLGDYLRVHLQPASTSVSGYKFVLTLH